MNIVAVNRRSKDTKNKKTRRELTSINRASPVGMWFPSEEKERIIIYYLVAFCFISDSSKPKNDYVAKSKSQTFHFLTIIALCKLLGKNFAN